MNLIDLSQAIATNAPCGQNLEYTADFLEMEITKQGKPEHQEGALIIPATPPDWKLLKEQTVNLAKLTHDLRVTTNLTIALVHLEGFKGLEQGLQLTASLLASFWECLYPELDSADPNPTLERCNILLEIVSHNFLQTIKELPLLSSKRLGKFSIYSLQEGLSLQNSTSEEENKRYRLVEALFQDLALEALQESLQLLENCKQQAQSVQQLFESHISSHQNTPNLKPLNELLDQGIKILKTKVATKTIATSIPPTPPDNDESSSESPLSINIPISADIDLDRTNKMPIHNNEQVHQALEQICAYYARYEPSSPVPLLLKRAQRLVGKDFLEIAQDLNPDSLSQFEHLFGKN